MLKFVHGQVDGQTVITIGHLPSDWTLKKGESIYLMYQLWKYLCKLSDDSKHKLSDDSICLYMYV